VRIEAQPGSLYRVADIQFTGATVFDQAELRKKIRLKAGDPFSLAAILQGIEAVHKLYSTKGYIDAALEPQMDIDDEKLQINLTMKVTEEAQYRVGSVEILGLDDAAKNRLMERLQPGRVFDMSVLKPFREMDERSVEIRRNVRDRTVNLVVDARKTCPDSDGKW
jgi:outer membrane protein assembly factor BamA